MMRILFMRFTWLLIFAILATGAYAQTYVPPVLQQYDSKYYTIYTDLNSASAREIVLRMTRMADEYRSRTAAFGHFSTTSKLPFYVFRKENDYNEAGGTENSGGVFTGDRLLAWAGDRLGPMSWHIIQHEGFHQFAKASIGGGLPIWCNEGLAEYFGEGLYTGDGFVTGLIPQERLERIRELLKTPPVDRILTMSHEDWNAGLAQSNYDVAWSMVQFLAHADGGKYQQSFIAFINAAGKGQDANQAWQRIMGPPAAFEERWKKYWSELPDDPTGQQYDQAAVSVVTSFLARAVIARKSVADVPAMVHSFDQDEVAMSQENWLPATLLHTAMRWTKKAKWSVETAEKKLPAVVLTREDGCKIVGSFTLNSGRIGKVSTDFDDLPKTIDQAKKMINDGKVRQARVLLVEGLRKHPHSTVAKEARELLATNG